MNDTFIANQIVDLLRRRLFGLQLTDSCITFRPGHDRPLLVVSEAAKSYGTALYDSTAESYLDTVSYTHLDVYKRQLYTV